MKRHVAVDLGASGGRVALGTIHDGKLEVEILHRFWNGGVPVQGGLYWDVFGLWREILKGLKMAAEHGDIESVGVNSWGVDYALLGPDSKMLDGVHHYRDARTNGVMEQVFAKLPKESIYSATGIQFMQLNTIFQLVAHGKQSREIFRNAQRLLMFPDLLHYWLSGQMVTERTIASTSQLYDPTRCNWSQSLIESLGIPYTLFGPIADPGTEIGRITAEVAEQTGLEGTRVILPAAHDTGSAVAAVPAEGEGWAYISSGTWSLVGVESPRAIISEETARQNLTNEAGVKGTTRLLKNVMGLWILQECRRAWADPPYGDLYSEAQAVASGGPTIDPDDNAFLLPCEDMPERVQGFCIASGQPEPKTRGEITRCILDSLAKRSAEVLDGLELVTGKKIHTVHIVGGGSQIEFLNQLIANLSGRRVIAGPTEATLMGNLLIQAEAAGTIPEGSIRKVVRESVELKAFEPVGAS